MNREDFETALEMARRYICEQQKELFKRKKEREDINDEVFRLASVVLWALSCNPMQFREYEQVIDWVIRGNITLRTRLRNQDAWLFMLKHSLRAVHTAAVAAQLTDSPRKDDLLNLAETLEDLQTHPALANN